MLIGVWREGEEMTDTPPSDGPSQGADFDMISGLDWKDGIASLPGSDIKVYTTLFRTSTFLFYPHLCVS